MIKSICGLIIFILFSTFSFSQGYSWTLKNSGNSLGNPIDVDKNNSNIVYYGTGNRIYRSIDRGETFSEFGNIIPNSSRIKSIILNSKDPSSMLVAVESTINRIVKTNNSGKSWETVADNLNFSFFGIPMTPVPNNSNTIYTMSNNHFMVSYDFGEKWDTISTVSGFATPCDIEVFPDSSNIILVGDDGTGIFRSTDYGLTWTNVFSTSGEIPTIVMDTNKPGIAWATRWGGGGGFLRSTNYGLTWQAIPFFNGKNMWGVDLARNSSDFIITAQYSGGIIFLSKDGGDSWIQTSIGGNNYSIYIVDTITIFAAQSTGFYKMNVPYVPVELTSFSHSTENNSLTLFWETATEINNYGFEIEASKNGIDFEPITFIPGHGTTTEKKNYHYNVGSVFSAYNFFRLKQLDHDGTFEYSSTIEIGSILPSSFELSQNFPNPFNPSTSISFSLPIELAVKLDLYNSLGEKVKQILQNNFDAGTHKITLNAADLSSGIYFYIMNADGKNGEKYSQSKKLILLK